MIAAPAGFVAVLQLYYSHDTGGNRKSTSGGRLFSVSATRLLGSRFKLRSSCCLLFQYRDYEQCVCRLSDVGCYYWGSC
jgi:hypothetical protein